jgi:hypothetical protein
MTRFRHSLPRERDIEELTRRELGDASVAGQFEIVDDGGLGSRGEGRDKSADHICSFHAAFAVFPEGEIPRVAS